MLDIMHIQQYAMNLLKPFLKWFRKKPAFHLRYESRMDMLCVYTRGEILTREDLLSHAMDIDREATRLGHNKVFSDLVETTFTNDIVVYSELTNAYVSETNLVKNNFQFACLIRKEFEEVGRFWEMACQNRGIKARVFFEEKEALDWLNSSGL